MDTRDIGTDPTRDVELFNRGNRHCAGDMEREGRRILHNTGWLYARFILTSCASLLVVRLLIRSFGVSGYGVCSVVFGVLEVVFFARWTMEVTIRRFLCRALGRGDRAVASHFFSAGCIGVFGATAFLAVLSETLGIWFLENKLGLSSACIQTGKTFFHWGVLLMFVESLRLPWAALVISDERMDVLAKASFVEAFLSLGAAGAVVLVDHASLSVYGVLLVIKSLAVLTLYVFFCRRHYPDLVDLRLIRVKDLEREGSFFAKGLLTDVVNLLKYQGVNLLLGAYAGTAYNATWNVGMKLGVGVYGLVGGFQESVFPQLVKRWERVDPSAFVVFISGVMRWSALLVGVCSVPVLFGTQFVLSLWLGRDLPPQMVAFARCAAVHFFFDAVSAPLRTVVFAAGRIGRYQAMLFVVMGSGFLLAWFCLSQGMPAWMGVASVALTNILAFLCRLWYVQRYLRLPVLQVFRRAFLPWRKRMI